MLEKAEPGPSRAGGAVDARRFLDAPEAASFTRRDSRPWTQEVYLLQSRRNMALWLLSRLDPRRDAALDERRALLVEAL